MTQNTVSNPRAEAHASTAFDVFRDKVRYSFTDTLRADPQATADGRDHQARQVFSGHYVPVTPTPLADPVYVSHSPALFRELGLADELATNERFRRMFSGDLSLVTPPLRPVGWATGYALSIYGTEYTQQCPFRTGNGYGDGRAISVCEIEHAGKRWELQLKGAGRTPYCRGGDGRAVLRSSVREFLAQEFMHSLGVPTSRSLTLYASTTETVMRPWYAEGSCSIDPDVMASNPVAIATRVAPSFLRVGQIELFARRARRNAHAQAMVELEQIVAHAIAREYRDEIDAALPFPEQVLAFATQFRRRLIALVGHWMRVGYCQGNFNSDNCAIGGFTLDYGPFGFCETFDPRFQPWTGGGEHFSFFNQPVAAEANFHMLWAALGLLIPEGTPTNERFLELRRGFAEAMHHHLDQVWASKLGLREPRTELATELFRLMHQSQADFTITFRELCRIPATVSSLAPCFPGELSSDLASAWDTWLTAWREALQDQRRDELDQARSDMERINPIYTWREWLIAPAYQRAAEGDYALLHELQTILGQPYAEHAPVVHDTHYARRPDALADLGGISHYSCSS